MKAAFQAKMNDEFEAGAIINPTKPIGWMAVGHIWIVKKTITNAVKRQSLMKRFQLLVRR